MALNVLYFLDPLTMEPGTRWPTLKWHIEPMAKLVLEGDAVNLVTVCDERVASLATQEGLCATVRVMNGVSEMRRESTVSRREALAQSAVTSALGSWRPDLVIAYETDAPWLHDLFPAVPVVNEAWGLLSRPPFPALLAHDPFGVYEKSVLAQYCSELRARVLRADEAVALLKIRNIAFQDLVQLDPLDDLPSQVRTRYRRAILLPLQLDNHDSFRKCCNYHDHEELVHVVCSALPNDIAVIVTQHPDHGRVLDQAVISVLRQQHPNFVYFEATEKVPMLSQNWLVHVDAVATVSSGVAFQAALLGVPVVALGSAHTNAVASFDLESFSDKVKHNSRIELEALPGVDAVVWWILSRYSVFAGEVRVTAAALASHFNRLRDTMANRLANLDPLSWPERFTPDQLLALYQRHARKGGLETIYREAGIQYRTNSLLAAIGRAEAVSFDLFDTLVQRPLVEPHDLFLLIENKGKLTLDMPTFVFTKWRRRAEENARKKRNGKEVTIYQIYYEFGLLTGLKPVQCQQLLEVELEAELQVIERREAIYSVYRWCQRLGKKVTIITDIYLLQSHIGSILERVNIRGYDQLMVSAELDLRKHDGTIYPYYLNSLRENYHIVQNAEKSAVLHVGDNHRADVEKAQENGLAAYRIIRNSDYLRQSHLRTAVGNNIDIRSTRDSVMLGIMANRFDEALATRHKSSLFGGSLYAMGYISAAPMLVAFVEWLIERVVDHGAHRKVCFLARDGHILKLIYDQLRSAMPKLGLPESDYLYLSRRATALASCRSSHDLSKLLHLSFGDRSLVDLLCTRFGLDQADIPVHVVRLHGFDLKDRVSFSNDLGRLHDLVMDLSPQILGRAQIERDGLVAYLASHGIDRDQSDVCFVDIGYSGSIQRYVNEILESKVAGYYMLTHHSVRPFFDDIVFEGWFDQFDEPRSVDHHPLNDHVFLFESLLSSEESSVRCHVVDSTGALSIEWTEDQHISRKIFIREVHAGVLDFTLDYVSAMQGYMYGMDVGYRFGSKIFFHLANYPTRADAELFLGLGVENSFGGGDAHLLYNPLKVAQKSQLTKAQVDAAIGYSQWKAAARVLFAPPPPPPSSPVVGSGNPDYRQQPQVVFKHRDLPPAVKKYLKYKNRPYDFFNDSKNPVLRLMRYYYQDPDVSKNLH